MFDQLSNRISQAISHVAGKKVLSDANMQSVLKEIKKALLEADVDYQLVKQFVKQIRDDAKGVTIGPKLSPAQAIIKIVNERLIEVMGSQVSPLDLKAARPIVVLMAGLQGAGKTTSAGKLARYLTEREKSKVMLASCDVYRPAAIEQLKTLAEQIPGTVWHESSSEDVLTRATSAFEEAKKAQADVLIVDTAGRLAIDQDMMAEIKALHENLNPHETLFVVDGMTGQDAAKTAKAFHEVLPLTGVVVTKLDGDARGGAVLSVTHMTQKPIKFIGMGEKTDALEPFHPDRMASRILGMGDVLSLVEEIERKVDKDQAERLAEKFQKGKTFDLEDFRQQLLQMQKMGGMGALLDKMPGMGQIPDNVKQQASEDKSMPRIIAVINSMTPEERRKPEIIKGSRKQRIAAGSGTDIQFVNRVLKQSQQMQKMMKKMRSPGAMRKMQQSLNEMGGQGGLPPGLFK